MSEANQWRGAAEITDVAGETCEEANGITVMTAFNEVVMT